MNDWKYVGNIMDLVYLAETDFLICEKTYRFLNSNLSNRDFFILSANNGFNESIGIIHTLICSSKKEELGIEQVLREIIDKDKKNSIPKLKNEQVDAFVKFIEVNYPNPDYSQFDFGKDATSQIGNIMADLKKIKRITSGLDDLKALKNKFESYNFHKIRHQTVAHKNKLLQAPAGAASLLLKDDLIKKLGEIIKILRINCYMWFDYELSNPYNSILASLDNVITMNKIK